MLQLSENYSISCCLQLWNKFSLLQRERSLSTQDETTLAATPNEFILPQIKSKTIFQIMQQFNVKSTVLVGYF